jgi:hypothetical protein
MIMNISYITKRKQVKFHVNFISYFAFIVIFLSSSIAHSATITNKNTNGGNWGTNTTWTSNTPPTSADDVIITTASNKDVTVNVNVTIVNLTISSNTNLVINNTLTLTGSLVNNGTITFGASGQIIQSGNFTNNGTFTAGTGTVTLNGTTEQLIGGTTNPTSFYNLTIANTAGVKLAASFRANITNNLTINSEALLDIEPGRFVNAQKIVNNAEASGLIIRASASNAGGTLIFNNIESEDVQGTVEMYTKAYRDVNSSPQYKWQFFGIPLRTLATANPTFNGSFVRRHNEAGTGSAVWVPLTNSSPLTTFSGYQITQADAKTIIFTGTLENRDRTIDIAYTSGATNPGQHVLANSYTAAIDIKQISFGTEMDSAVYFYNTGSRSDWEQYSSSGNNPGQYLTVPRGTAGSGGLPGSIPSMQGFLVRTKGSNPSTISIPYSSVAVKNAEQLRVKSNNNEKIFSIINVNGSRFNDKMWLFSEPGKSRGYDNGWDGRKVFGSAAFPQIFAAEHDGNYQVNTVDDINNTLLGFRAGEDLSYTLTFNHSNTELKYQQITLTDLLTQQTVDITEDGSQYAFVHDPAFVGARFRINSTNINSDEDDTEDDTETEVQPEKDFKVYYSSGNLIVNNPADVAGSVYLYDLKNQAVKVFSFGGKSISQFPVQLPTGVYLAKASAGKLKHNLNFIIK